MRLPLLALAALLPAALAALPSPLLEYKFNESSANYASAGRLKPRLLGLGSNQSPGAPGSGVSGLPADRAWDASANTTQGVGLPANNSALISTASDLRLSGLKAFTLSFWYKTEHPLSPDAATRFVIKADRPTEPISQGLALRSFKGSLELRLGAMTADGKNTPVEGVITSTRYREGFGYNRVNTWIFVAITWDGRDVRFYAADRDSAVTLAGGDTFSGVILDDPGLLVLGNARAYNRGLDGLMDNFRLHDDTLTVSQLDELRRADLAGR